MKIIEKNAGPKIPYEVDGTRIIFDDDLTVNCAKRQQDDDVHEDICYDNRGQLVIGAAAGRRYVAEIDIPAKQYIYHDAEATNGEDGMMRDVEPPTPIPLNMDDVTLILWAIE